MHPPRTARATERDVASQFVPPAVTGFRQEARSAERCARILVVIPKLTVGGTETHLLEVLPRLDRRKFSVSVITTRGAGSLDHEIRARGISIITPPVMFDGKLNAAPAALYLALHMAKNRPEIVHFFLPEAYLVGGLCALLTGRPRLVMSRRNLNSYRRGRPVSSRMERLLHARMDAVVGNSSAIVAQLAAEGVPARRLGLIRNGLDPARFGCGDRKRAREALRLPHNTLVLSMVATLFSYKGHADLLAALGRVSPRLPPDWVLLLAGRDQDRIQGRLQTQAKELGIARHVRWLGERRQVTDLLRASDIGLLCSHEEGLSNSVLEGMAAGLPMIATSVGGNPEAVQHGLTGLLVPPRDSNVLGNAILELANDPDKRRAMGAAGRNRVADCFSLQACVARYEALYRALLAGDSRPIAEILGYGAGDRLQGA